MSEPSGCQALAEAFTIFARYSDEPYPTHCEHDVLYVYVEPSKVSQEDLDRLEALGFEEDPGFGDPRFQSFRFGSC